MGREHRSCQLSSRCLSVCPLIKYTTTVNIGCARNVPRKTVHHVEHEGVKINCGQLYPPTTTNLLSRLSRHGDDGHRHVLHRSPCSPFPHGSLVTIVGTTTAAAAVGAGSIRHLCRGHNPLSSETSGRCPQSNRAATSRRCWRCRWPRGGATTSWADNEGTVRFRCTG